MAIAPDRTARAAPVQLADPATYRVGVPHAEFARRRREAPVSWVAEQPRVRPSSAGPIVDSGSGYWAVTTHAAVVAASREPGTFSSGRRGAFLNDPRTKADLEFVRQLLINMDAPEHTAVRRVVSAVFTPRAVGRLRDQVTDHARTVIRGCLEKDRFDVVTDLAAEVPLLVLADLLGIPRADRHLLYGWSNRLVGFDDPEYGGGDVEAYRQAFAEAFQYALRVAEERRRAPRDDLVTRLATAEVAGRRLSDREFCQFWLLLVVAGNETTRHLISGSVQALVEHPGERDRLHAAGQDALPTAVEELVRWVTPIMQFRRTATGDTELAGQPIAEGDKVVLYYASANRDGHAIPGADRLDLARDPNPHLSFGIGPHFCLGAHLARLELSAVLTELLPHLPAVELDGPQVRLESNFVNGIKSMPVRVRA
ncbi:cytochrome P450 [Micromonospora sp. CPCC 206061]|uniref:cytochrome P450 n=1 Tax=Micromonospora sp. CPCC 206061 TaxID=3122410 RepID=UPI002FF0572D